MANVKISQLASAAALTGTEEVPVVQSNATVKTTAQDIANLASGGGSGLAMPTLTVVPSIPSDALQPYFIPKVYKINGQTIQSSKYGIETSFLMMGGTGSYYNNNKITQFSTNAEVIDSIPTYTFDSTITSLSLPTVKVLGNGNGMLTNLFIDSSTQLNSISLPNLLALDGINIQGMNVNSLDFSSLLSISNTCSIQYISNNTDISFPALQYIGQSLTINGFFSSNLGFPQLKNIGYTIDINLGGTFGMPATIDFSSLESFYSITINSSDVTQFDLPSLKSVGICTMQQFYTSLDQTSVDNVLTAFAALDGTNGTSVWNCGSIYIAGGNAAPSATGLAAISTLTGRGISVTYN